MLYPGANSGEYDPAEEVANVGPAGSELFRLVRESGEATEVSSNTVHDQSSTDGSGSEQLELSIVSSSEVSGYETEDDKDGVFDSGVHLEGRHNHDTDHNTTNEGEEGDTPLLGESLEEISTNASRNQSNNSGEDERQVVGVSEVEEHVSEASDGTSNKEESEELENLEQESSTGEAEGETEEDLEGTSEFSQRSQEGEVTSLATSGVISRQVPGAVIGGGLLPVGEASLGGITLNSEVNGEVLGSISLAFSVGSKSEVVAFISLGGSVEVVGGELGVMENILASVVIKLSRGLISFTKAEIRSSGLEHFILQVAVVLASLRCLNSIQIVFTVIQSVATTAETSLEDLSSITISDSHRNFGFNFMTILKLFEGEHLISSINVRGTAGVHTDFLLRRSGS